MKPGYCQPTSKSTNQSIDGVGNCLYRSVPYCLNSTCLRLRCLSVWFFEIISRKQIGFQGWRGNLRLEFCLHVQGEFFWRSLMTNQSINQWPAYSLERLGCLSLIVTGFFGFRFNPGERWYVFVSYKTRTKQEVEVTWGQPTMRNAPVAQFITVSWSARPLSSRRSYGEIIRKECSCSWPLQCTPPWALTTIKLDKAKAASSSRRAYLSVTRVRLFSVDQRHNQIPEMHSDRCSMLEAADFSAQRTDVCAAR